MIIKTQTITVMGQDWNVAVLGPKNADRTMLVCNGIGASLDTIGPFAEHFKRTRIIAFDVPGVGGSPVPWIPYRFSNLTRMLNKILDVLEVGKVDVFGVSWGGALAQQFAFDFQDRCHSLTLAATAAGLVMVPGKISVMSKMITPKRYQDPNYMLEIAPHIYGGDLKLNKELLERHAGAMRTSGKRGYAYQLLAGAGWTSYFWLSQIKLPTLILMGDQDPLVPPANGKILASRIKNSTLEMISCGHMFVLTQAEIVADRVEEFIHEENMVAA